MYTNIYQRINLHKQRTGILCPWQVLTIDPDKLYLDLDSIPILNISLNLITDNKYPGVGGGYPET